MKKSELSYGRYLEEKKLSPLSDYENALLDVRNTADAVSPLRGVGAERLAGLGLSKSGYADYLKNAAKEREESARAAAYADYEKDIASAALGYRDYLTSLREETAVTKESVAEAIRKKGTLNEDEAYLYAKEAGLSEEEARDAARTGVEETKTALMRKILAVVQRDGMGREHAIAYAEGQGLSPEDAEKIGDYAEAWNRMYAPSSALRQSYND